MTSLNNFFCDQSSVIPHYISFDDMNLFRAYDFGMTEQNSES